MNEQETIAKLNEECKMLRAANEAAVSQEQLSRNEANRLRAKAAELRETLKRAVPFIVRSPEAREPLLSDCKRVLRSD